MPRFETLPLEVRWKIYSYLLLAENAWNPKRIEDKLSLSEDTFIHSPKFTTGLFITNRQISHESRTYFYRENAFVAIRLPSMDTRLILYAQQLFPCVILGSELALDTSHCLSNAVINTVFRYDFRSGSSRTVVGDRLLVFGANRIRDFRRLIDLRSQGCPPLSRKEYSGYIEDYYLNPSFENQNGYRERIQEPWNNIRHVSKTEDKNHPSGSTIILDIHMDPKFVLEDCVRLFEMGVSLNAERYYCTAMAYFNIVAEAIGTTKRSFRSRMPCSSLMAKVELYSARNYIDLGGSACLYVGSACQALINWIGMLEEGRLAELPPDALWSWYEWAVSLCWEGQCYHEVRELLDMANVHVEVEPNILEERKKWLLEMRILVAKVMLEYQTPLVTRYIKKKEQEGVSGPIPTKRKLRGRNKKY